MRDAVMGGERVGAGVADAEHRVFDGDTGLLEYLVDGRPEPAAGRPHATDLDLNALAESAVSAVRPLAEEAGLAFSGELHAQLPHVVAGRDAKTRFSDLLDGFLTKTEDISRSG